MPGPAGRGCEGPVIFPGASGTLSLPSCGGHPGSQAAGHGDTRQLPPGPPEPCHLPPPPPVVQPGSAQSVCTHTHAHTCTRGGRRCGLPPPRRRHPWVAPGAGSSRPEEGGPACNVVSEDAGRPTATGGQRSVALHKTHVYLENPFGKSGKRNKYLYSGRPPQAQQEANGTPAGAGRWDRSPRPSRGRGRRGLLPRGTPDTARPPGVTSVLSSPRGPAPSGLCGWGCGRG